MAAVTARASGRSSRSLGWVASVLPHRGQRALPPGGIGGKHCNRSHSEHETVSMDASQPRPSQFNSSSLKYFVPLTVIEAERPVSVSW